MIRYLIGVIIVLHGLVHLWYVVLARGLVEYKPEMGWSGRSWLFTSLTGDPATRNLASILLPLADEHCYLDQAIIGHMPDHILP